MHNGTLTPNRVIEEVALLLRTTPGAVLSDTRQEPVRSARNLCAYIMRQHIPSMSYREIAQSLGRTNHSTAMSSVRRIENAMDTDDGMRQLITAIERGLTQVQLPTDPNQMAFAWMLTSGGKNQRHATAQND